MNRWQSFERLPGDPPHTGLGKRVAGQRDALRACNDALQARRPATRGRVSTKFHIASDGTTQGACVTASAIDDPPFLACVAEAFAAIRWPEREPDDPCGGHHTVVYPLLFSDA